MSEVFDPEKVERLNVGAYGDIVEEANPYGIYVSSDDYDKLLALYREMRDRPYSTWPQGG